MTRIARGDLGLSVEITLFLVKLTAFTAPLTVEWMLGARSIEVHELQLMLQLALLQVLPYFIGKQLRRRRPAVAARLTRPVRMAALAFVAAAVALLLWHRQLRSVLLIAGGGGWLAVLSMAAAALALGWLLGGRTGATRRAVALSVNARELPLALMIAALTHPDETLESVIFAVWLVLAAINLGFAALTRRRGARVATPSTVRSTGTVPTS
jgi:BASS family bile acid:Na+ symporter